MDAHGLTKDTKDLTKDTKDLAKDLTKDVSRIADEAADKAGSLARGVVSVLGRLIGLVAQLLTVLPAIPSRILAVVSTMLLRLGTASAEQAGLAPPVVDTRRGSRRKAILWFAGGFTAGAASGYAAAQLAQNQQDDRSATVTSLPGRHDGTGTTG